MRKWGIIVAAIVLVAVLSVAGFFVFREQRAEAARCEAVEKLREGLPATIGEGPALTVVGDSYSQGWGLDDPSKSWVASLHHKVTVKASSGAGYTKGGLCGGESIPALADGLSGDVLIQSGLNDVDAADVEARAVETIREVRGHPVLVGPTLVPSLDPEKVRAVDAVLAKAASENGARYISAIDWELPFSDGLHLTPAGHQQFGALVAAQL